MSRNHFRGGHIEFFTTSPTKLFFGNGRLAFPKKKKFELWDFILKDEHDTQPRIKNRE